MSKDTYTEEELATLPQTTQVFDRPPLEFDNHQWQQEGYFISDICNPKGVNCQVAGIPIGNGKMLVKEDGRYSIVDEGRS